MKYWELKNGDWVSRDVKIVKTNLTFVFKYEGREIGHVKFK